VLLRLPGAHDEVLASRCRPPVDGAHVVAVDPIAQAVELGALPAHPHGGAAVDLPQLGQPARDVAPRREGMKRAQRPAQRHRGLSGGDPQWAEGADRHPVGQPVAASLRGQLRPQEGPFTSRHGEGEPVRAGTGRGLPGVPDPAAQGSPTRVGHQHLRMTPLPDPHLPQGPPRQADPRGGRGEQQVDSDDEKAAQDPQAHGPATGPDDDRHQTEEDERDRARGQCHRVSAGRAPSSARCRGRSRFPHPRARPPGAG